ncbi:hypothetical protein BH18ACT5_BH18ACT5_07930 [soil metagenome]
MTVLAGQGIEVTLPPGWEGTIGRSAQLDDGAVHRTVAHFASFPLPAKRGDYGGGAVERMGSGDALVVLFEFGPEAVGSILFAAEGVPEIGAADFDRSVLQRSISGHSGVQRFFTVSGRTFCLYVVAGSHLDRIDSMPAVTSLLASLRIR